MNKAKELLQKISAKAFVDYYYVLEENQDSSSNKEIISEFHKNNENWSDNACSTRASKGKKIFKEGLETDALRYIMNSANEQKVGAEVIEKAQKIYASKKLSLDPNVFNKTSNHSTMEQLLLEVDIDLVKKIKNISKEEKEALVKIRLGQSSYRNELIKLWGGCAVTDCKNTDLLLASHIKAYKLCDEQEKYDKFNGLLLSPTYDKLFDLYLISFEEDGGILISEDIVDNDLKALNISRNDRLRQIFPENQKYLQHHRDRFFNPNN